MYPIYNIQGIENEEKKIEEKHLVKKKQKIGKSTYILK